LQMLHDADQNTGNQLRRQVGTNGAFLRPLLEQTDQRSFYKLLPAFLQMRIRFRDRPPEVFDDRDMQLIEPLLDVQKERLDFLSNVLLIACNNLPNVPFERIIEVVNYREQQFLLAGKIFVKSRFTHLQLG